MGKWLPLAFGAALVVAHASTFGAAEAVASIDSYFGEINDRTIQVRVYPPEGVVLGQGWDLFLNRKATGFCVGGRVVEDSSNAAAAVTFSRIEDHEQIFDALNIEASASYSGFGVSASAKTTFSKSLHVASDALNILAKIKLDRSVTALLPEDGAAGLVKSGKLALSDQARSLLDPKNTDAFANKRPVEEQKAEAYRKFRARCGDAFVIGIRKGGELDAFLTFKFADRQAKQSLASALEAGGYGASMEVAVANIKNDASKKSSLEYRWFQSGSTPGTSNALTVDDFLKNFAAFGKDKFGEAPYEMYILSYSQLENATAADLVLPNNSYLNQISNHYWRLIDLYQQYSDVVAHPDLYHVTPFVSKNKGWLDIYDRQAYVLRSAQALDTQLAICFREKKCDPETNLEITNRRLNKSAAFALLLGAGSGHDSPAATNLLRQAAAHAASGPTPLVEQASSKIGSDAAVPELSAPAKADDPDLLKDYELYYYWLAAKPIGKIDITDLWLLTHKADKTIKDGVRQSAGTAPPTPDELVAFATQEARLWLLRTRLLPVSDAFCRKSAQHPLCIPTGRLAEIVGSVPISFDANSLSPATPPPPPPPPPVVHQTLRPPYYPCGRSGLLC